MQLQDFPGDSQTGGVVVLGAGGRLGKSLVGLWRTKLPVFPFTRKELDICNRDALISALEEAASRGATAVVNASGMTNLEACEDDPSLADAVNHRAVAHMADWCAKNGLRLFHFSTDYVFDGKKEEPYFEEDAPAPLSVYGKSKLDGEIAALSADGGNFVFRVAWVFGPARPAFPDIIIRRAIETAEVSVVFDKWASPTSAPDVAEWLLPLILRAHEPSLPGGLFHLCNSGVCSWLDYACHALQAAREIGVPVKTTRPSPVPLASMQIFRAARPVRSGMWNTKFSRTFGTALRPWQESLTAHVRTVFANPAD